MVGADRTVHRIVRHVETMRQETALNDGGFSLPFDDG
jgi:hypothetical protein